MPEFCPNCMATVESEAACCPRCGWSMSWKNDENKLPVNTILKGRYLVGRAIDGNQFDITYVGLDLTSWTKVAIKEYYPYDCAQRRMDTAVRVIPQQIWSPTPEKDFAAGKVKFAAMARAMDQFKTEPSIVDMRDYFEENGTAYIVMEFLEGKDLDTVLKENGRSSMSEMLAMLEPVMAALEKVHARGLIHGDINPESIMLLPDGRVKLLAFGTAKQHLYDGNVELPYDPTPGYVTSDLENDPGPWCDVYALCATMYRMITGKIPPNLTDRTVFRNDLKNPSELGAVITPVQEAALMKGLAIDSADRIRSIGGLRKAFAGETDIRKDNGKPQKPKRQQGASAAKSAGKRRSGIKIIIAAVAAVLVIAAGVLIFTHASAQKDQPVIMPDVIGVDRDHARDALEGLGLEVVEAEAEKAGYDADVVIDQSIKPGEEVEAGMVVKLTINVIKDKDSNVSESAPPIESSVPDSTDTDGLEHGGGGIFGGYSGDYGGGYSGDYSGDYGGDTSDDSGDTGSSGGSPASTPSPSEGGSGSGSESGGGTPSGSGSGDDSGSWDGGGSGNDMSGANAD